MRELQIDASKLLETVSTLEALLENVADFPVEVRELALAFCESDAGLVCAREIAASGAGNCCVGLYPGDRLLELLAALRAAKIEGGVVECAHKAAVNGESA